MGIHSKETEWYDTPGPSYAEVASNLKHRGYEAPSIWVDSVEISKSTTKTVSGGVGSQGLRSSSWDRAQATCRTMSVGALWVCPIAIRAQVQALSLGKCSWSHLTCNHPLARAGSRLVMLQTSGGNSVHLQTQVISPRMLRLASQWRCFPIAAVSLDVEALFD
jgi:hypothetical protein